MNEFLGHASTDLAMQFLREGKLHECIGCAEKVISSHPDDAKAYTILGAAYAQAGDRGMAIAAFEQSLALEPSARAHFNLGMAYEKSGRTREALDQYEKAMHMDPFYRAAAEAVSRLSKTVQTKPAPVQTTGPTPPPAPHLLTGEDEPVPTYSGHQPGPQTAAADLKPVGIPAAPPPPAATPGRLPDLRSLEMRTRENEEKARQAQREMTKAGLIYGMILGPIGLMGALGLSRVFLPVTSGFFLFVLGAGVVLGAIVGLWTGFTCGDETTGAKTGALLGLLGLGIPALIGGGGTLGMTGVVLQAVLGLVLGGAAGYFIGMMVEHSIGQ